jgi:DNA replication protein DnaC
VSNSLHEAIGPATSQIAQLARRFRLPTVAELAVSRFLEAGQAEALPILAEVFELEAQDRQSRKVERLRKESRLPPGKDFSTLDMAKFPKKLSSQILELATGDFIDRAANIIAFGLPGVGKSHACCAIGHALVSAGRSVRYTPTFRLVQELLAAKKALDLPRALRKLDNFEVLILDDIGYVQQSPEEVEVLFTLFSERYERRSLVITSNLVFSEWDQIFKNPMTTVAAIDRVVHHSTILEFKVPSYRSEQAKSRAGKRADSTGGTGDSDVDV